MGAAASFLIFVGLLWLGQDIKSAAREVARAIRDASKHNG